MKKAENSQTAETQALNIPVVTNRCSNFQQVLANGDDQVLVRKLLNEHVPIEIQIKITQSFNQEFARREVLRNGW